MTKKHPSEMDRDELISTIITERAFAALLKTSEQAAAEDRRKAIDDAAKGRTIVRAAIAASDQLEACRTPNGCAVCQANAEDVKAAAAKWVQAAPVNRPVNMNNVFPGFVDRLLSQVKTGEPIKIKVGADPGIHPALKAATDEAVDRAQMRDAFARRVALYHDKIPEHWRRMSAELGSCAGVTFRQFIAVACRDPRAITSIAEMFVEGTR